MPLAEVDVLFRELKSAVGVTDGGDEGVDTCRAGLEVGFEVGIVNGGGGGVVELQDGVCGGGGCDGGVEIVDADHFHQELERRVRR